jgi:hypothetical protein
VTAPLGAVKSHAIAPGGQTTNSVLYEDPSTMELGAAPRMGTAPVRRKEQRQPRRGDCRDA